MTRRRVRDAARARKGGLAALVALGLVACAWARPGAPPPEVFRGPELVFGGERYSAWFGDERDGVLYFGLSPFWTELWTSGDPAADRRHSGPHLIGRFDLARGVFLPPLVAREAAPDVRSSVWDVLAHPNGWVYYTTFFEEMGRVQPATGAVERFAALGLGLNELAVGPDGSVYATRYGTASGAKGAPGGAADGSLVVLSEDGRLLHEIPLHARDGAFTAPKSVAVDPKSGRVFLNADVLLPDGSVEFARFVIEPDLESVYVLTEVPELLFVAFDASGRGILVEDDSGRLKLTIGDGERELASADLGPREAADFAQDIHFAADGTAVIAFWSGRVELVRERSGRFERASLALAKPADCGPPPGRSLVYSGFADAGAVYATLYCGSAVLRAPLPAQWRALGE